MRTFADWLRYYNNLDVAPQLEALEKMSAFYTDKDIDSLKNAVSLPGMSIHYLLRGIIEFGGELYSHCKEVYILYVDSSCGGRSKFCVYSISRSGSDSSETTLFQTTKLSIRQP